MPPRHLRPSRDLVLALAALIALAAALRLPALAARPMHADEAIHADKLGTLLEGGGYAYDPTEYHGPTLYYLTLAPAWLAGVTRAVEVDERLVRGVPAVLGVLLVALHLGARGFLGTGWLAAGLLAALSPAMVYYSRYAIHETPLVLFTFLALLAGWHYLRAPSLTTAALLGLAAGLMLATKETAVLALAAMLLAAGITHLAARAGIRAKPWLKHAAAAVGAAGLVCLLFFSSFLTHPSGILDALRAAAFYLDRATFSWHVHSWDHYLRLLVHFPADGTPFWTEGAILALALVGAVAAWWPRSPEATPNDLARPMLRFLALYVAILTALYSAIPYKTPWCVLSFLHGMILLAGHGTAVLFSLAGGALPLPLRPAGRAARALVVCLLAGAALHLGWQAHAASFRFAADPRNPYVYAHTSDDVFAIVRGVEALTRVHPDGPAMAVQVVSRENLWPLPFYFRRLKGVSWWTGVADEAGNPPLVLLTPDQEAPLVRRLYELPPPGERELYVSVFDRTMWLRPGVELRGYAARSLWESRQQRGAP